MTYRHDERCRSALEPLRAKYFPRSQLKLGEPSLRGNSLPLTLGQLLERYHQIEALLLRRCLKIVGSATVVAFRYGVNHNSIGEILIFWK